MFTAHHDRHAHHRAKERERAKMLRNPEFIELGERALIFDDAVKKIEEKMLDIQEKIFETETELKALSKNKAPKKTLVTKIDDLKKNLISLKTQMHRIIIQGDGLQEQYNTILAEIRIKFDPEIDRTLEHSLRFIMPKLGVKAKNK